MRVSHSIALTLLALFSAVNADVPVLVVATIPDQSLLQNVGTNSSKGLHPPMKDTKVTGFISKDGDIFKLSEPRSITSIESRQEPPPKSETTMCRYGNIVVYSDADCNTLIKSPQSPEDPANAEPKKEIKQKPLRKNKGGIRKPNNTRRNKNKKNNVQTNKRGNQVRRNLAKKKGVTTNRRRNNLNLKYKRGENQRKKKNKQRNQRRGTNNNSKRKRINNTQTRSHEESVRFAIFYDRT